MAIFHAKKDAQQDRVKEEVPQESPQTGDPDADRWHELTAGLEQIGQHLDRTSRQVVEYLIGRSQPSATGDGGPTVDRLCEKIDTLLQKLDKRASGASAGDATEETVAAALGPLGEKIDRIASQLTSLAEAASGASQRETIEQALAQLRDGLGRQLIAVAEGVRRLEGRLEGGLQGLSDLLRPVEPEPAAAGPATSGDWQRIIFGAELAEHPELEFQRQQLLDGLMRGEPGACALIGQLIVFRSAVTERMPTLLKEIGEAYYRWQPKTRPGANRMEQVLVDWLQETMQEAGISNAIELVHPGERFDSTRHTAVSRGVEITEVHGWIVLRDNGKVYTKASVSAK